MRTILPAALCAMSAFGAAALAQDATVEMLAVSADGIGESIGTIQLSDGDGGLTLAVDVRGLTPGEHGFHLHQNGSCDPAANAEGQIAAALGAGGHYDPDDTGRHAGPQGDGHKGDLPVLTADGEGTATVELTAPHLTVADARGRALMIHAGGDNYGDEPQPLGGGGARVACGVVE